MNENLLKRLSKDALALTVELSKINSGTSNVEGIRTVAGILSRHLEESQFDCSLVRDRNLLARRKRPGGKKLVLLGHMDTVFEPHHPFKDVRLEGKYLFGPGVSDMKGGLSLAVHWIKYLLAEGLLDNFDITVLFNSDEETGSLLSRDLIESSCSGCDLALVFEGGKRVNETSTSYIVHRRCFAEATFTIQGKSASSPAAPWSAISAVEEMSGKIMELKKLNDPEKDIIVMVTGPIEIRPQKKGIIPDFAEFSVDLRCWQNAQMDALYQSLEHIAANHFVLNQGGEKPYCQLDFFVRRPAVEPNEQVLHYGGVIEQIGREMGYVLVEKPRLGGSDACFAASAGTSVIDAVGPVGDGWHSEGEYLEVDSLEKRLELLVRFCPFI